MNGWRTVGTWAGRGACLAAWLLLAAGVRADELATMRLLDGTFVSGALAPRPQGLYLSTATGGKLYRWSLVDPASLPAPLRASIREDLLARLAEADARYTTGDVPGAAPLYAQVQEARHFLTTAELAQPVAADLGLKARGLVRDGEQWLPFAEYQQRRGLAPWEGRWLPREEAEMRRAFRDAIAKARAGGDYADSIIDLEVLLARYPDSPYTTVVRQLISGLVAKALEPPPAAAPEAPRERVVYVREREPDPGPSISVRTYARFPDWADRPPYFVYTKDGKTYFVGGWPGWGGHGGHGDCHEEDRSGLNFSIGGWQGVIRPGHETINIGF